MTGNPQNGLDIVTEELNGFSLPVFILPCLLSELLTRSPTLNCDESGVLFCFSIYLGIYKHWQECGEMMICA